MIADRHHRSGRHVEPQAAGRVGLQQGLAAQSRHGVDGALHLVDPATFIVVRPALQHRDRGRADMAQDQPAGMTADRRLREVRQVGIGNGRDLRHFLDEAAEAGAENHRDLRAKAGGCAVENVVHGWTK